jgi:hypothetical protein
MLNIRARTPASANHRDNLAQAPDPRPVGLRYNPDRTPQARSYRGVLIQPYSRSVAGQLGATGSQ